MKHFSLPYEENKVKEIMKDEKIDSPYSIKKENFIKEYEDISSEENHKNLSSLRRSHNSDSLSKFSNVNNKISCPLE